MGKNAQKADTKMNLASHDVLADRLEQFKELFPEAWVEGKPDIEKLRQLLGDFAQVGSERYGLNWAGKSEAIRALQIPSHGTLVPMREQSVNFDESENLIIEGDNLEVLKLLQKSYHGKIKMIYIDPPYNTGGDFIYPDNFKEGLETYLKYSGQLNDEGLRTSTNAETGGRYHSNWLNLMYPRLFLAKNLLREDGVIFISIDDSEINNLKQILNELFGEENFIGNIVWNNSSRTSDYIATEHEYILVYAKSFAKLQLNEKWKSIRPEAEAMIQLVNQIRKEHESIPTATAALKSKIKEFQEIDKRDGTKKYSWLSNYSNIDENWGIYYAVDLSGEGDGPPRKFGDKIINAPSGRHWMSQEYIDELYVNNRIVWRGDRAYRKLYINETEENLKGIIQIPTRRGSEHLKQLLGKDIFDKPKPYDLIAHIIKFVCKDNDIVLDFFAGSGSTAEAVIDCNENDLSANFILVQLPEKLEEDNKNHSKALAAGYKNIAEICLDRVKKCILLREKRAGFIKNKAMGFRSFSLRSSNFKLWNPESAAQNTAALGDMLELYAENVLPGRSQEDILYEIILKAGQPLTEKIETVSFGNQKAFSIGNGILLICLEDPIEEKTLRAMVASGAEQIICLDQAFHGNDQLKTNIKLEMESNSKRFSTV